MTPQADPPAEKEPNIIRDFDYVVHLGPDGDESIVTAHAQFGVQSIETVIVA